MAFCVSWGKCEGKGESVAIVIGVGSHKGGVGKSTIARLIAAEYARNNWEVKIADLDLSQGTSYHWHERRLQAGV